MNRQLVLALVVAGSGGPKSSGRYWAPLVSLFHERMGDPTTPEGMKLLTEVSPLTHAAVTSSAIGITRGPYLATSGASGARSRAVAATESPRSSARLGPQPPEAAGHAGDEPCLCHRRVVARVG